MIWRPAQSLIQCPGYQTSNTAHGRFFIAYKDGSWQFNAPGQGWRGEYETEEDVKEAVKSYYDLL